MRRFPLFEIRTFGVDENFDVKKLLDFLQDEFIISRQTAKKMLKLDALLVYHLSKEDAREYVQRFKANGLICYMVQMVEGDTFE